MNTNTQILVTEGIGTFFLVTAVSFTGNPLIIGAVLMALVYISAHISGAHFNPAVTLATVLKRKMTWQTGILYGVAQLTGALVAAAWYFLTHQGSYFVPSPVQTIPWVGAFLVEAVFTFLLVRTVLTVAFDTKLKGNQYFGLAIGAALAVGAAVAGPLSGGVLNPALGVGPLLFDTPDLSSHIPLVLLYFFAPLVGATCATLI